MTLSASSADHLHVCHGAVSVCLSVCLSRQSRAAETCSWFAAARLLVADIDRQLPAGSGMLRSSSFYLLNAMVAVLLAVALCLSVTSRSSIETAERIELVFGVGATSTFRLSYTNLFKGNMGIFKNKGTLLQNFIQNSREKILLRRIDRRDVLWTLLDNGGRSERDKLHRCRSTNLRAPTLDRCSLS